MRPCYTNERSGFLFSVLWALIITGIIVYVESYLRTGIRNPLVAHYDYSLWYIAIPLFVLILVNFIVTKRDHWKEVERLEAQRDALKNEIPKLKEKQEQNLDALKRFRKG